MSETDGIWLNLDLISIIDERGSLFRDTKGPQSQDWQLTMKTFLQFSIYEGKMMKREEKSELISNLQTHLQSANGVFVIENHGLSVKETEDLRKQLRGLVSVFRVVKNRLMKMALTDTTFSPVSDLMKKPTAVAIAIDGLAVTKVLAKFAETHPNLTIVGGKMDSELLNADGVIQLSKLPSLLEIRATIARILVEPASRLARVSAEYGKKQ